MIDAKLHYARRPQGAGYRVQRGKDARAFALALQWLDVDASDGFIADDYNPSAVYRFRYNSLDCANLYQNA